jgi:hypothetical protein
MKAHPLVAIILVVLGLVAFEAMLPVWPEVRIQPSGLTVAGADLLDALGADFQVLRQRGAIELLSAIDAVRYLTVSLLLALVIVAAWLSRRYVAAGGLSDDHAAS